MIPLSRLIKTRLSSRQFIASLARFLFIELLAFGFGLVFIIYNSMILASLLAGLALWVVNETAIVYRRLLKKKIKAERELNQWVQREKEKLQEEANYLQQQLEHQKRQNLLRIQQEQRQRRELEQEIFDQNQAIQQFQSQISHYELQLDDYTELSRNLEQQEIIKKELEDTNVKLKESQVNSQKAQQKIQTLNANIQSLQTKNINFQARINQLSNVKDSNQELKIAIQQAQQEKNYAWQQAYEFEENNQQLQQLNGELEHKNKHLEYLNKQLTEEKENFIQQIIIL